MLPNIAGLSKRKKRNQRNRKSMKIKEISENIFLINMKNIPNLYVFELAINVVIIYYYLQDLRIIFTSAHFNPEVITFSTTLSVLILIKIQREGTRAPFLFQIITIVFLYITKIYQYPTTLAVITGFLIISQLWIFTLFPSFKYPEPTGPYDVGYTHFRLSDHTMVSVYYPVKKQGAVRPIYQMRDHSYIKLLFESTKVGWIKIKVPYFLFFLAKHFVMKVKINAKVFNIFKCLKFKGIIIPEKLKVILFSHGLGGHRDHYTCLTCEWASWGYTIFAPSHKEKIVPNWEDVAKFNVTKEDPLNVVLFKYYNDALSHRKSQFNLLLSSLRDKEKLKEIFQKDVEIDWDHCIGAGHSYGGSTIIDLALTEKTIKKVIALDPWFFPMEEQKLLIALEVPLFCVNSESFPKKSLEMFKVQEFTERFFKSQKKENFSTLIQINKCEHLNFSDYPFIAPRELNIVKMITSFDKITEFIGIANLLCLSFLSGDHQNEDGIINEFQKQEKQIFDGTDLILKIY